MPQLLWHLRFGPRPLFSPILSTTISTNFCPLVSTHVTPCHFLSHSSVPPNGVRENPCYNRRMSEKCSLVVRTGNPARSGYRCMSSSTAPSLFPSSAFAPGCIVRLVRRNCYSYRVVHWSSPKSRTVQNGTFGTETAIHPVILFENPGTFMRPVSFCTGRNSHPCHPNFRDQNVLLRTLWFWFDNTTPHAVVSKAG